MANEEILQPYGNRAMAVDSSGKVMEKVVAELEGSGSAIPVDIQARMTQLIQTQAGVNILPNAWNNGSWIDSHVDGSPLTHLGLSVNMTSGTGMTIAVDLSHDGINKFSGLPTWLYDGTGLEYSTDKDIQLSARYFRVSIRNKDATNPKVTNAYAYLKA